MTGELMGIGEFARRSRLPVSTLRYYHQIGVFEPAEVDAATGYRRYSRQQLPIAGVVDQLRRAGVGPDVISKLTSAPGSARTLLHQERQRIEADISDAHAALQALTRVEEQLGAPAPAPAAEVELRERRVAWHSGSINPQQATRGVRQLLAHLRRSTPPATSDVTYGSILPLDLEESTSVTVFHTAPPSGAKTCVLPGGPHAVTDHVGAWVEHAYAPLLDAAPGLHADHVIEDYRRVDGELVTRLALRLIPDTGD